MVAGASASPDVRPIFTTPMPTNTRLSKLSGGTMSVDERRCARRCKRYEDWELEDPEGKAVDDVRRIRDDIDARVQELLAELVS